MANKIFYFDVETTGLDPDRHAMYEFSYIIEFNGKIVEEEQHMIHPEEAEISDYLIEFFEKTDRRLEDLITYQSQGEFFNKLMDRLNYYIVNTNPKDKFLYCGYNVGFDFRFLKALFDRFENNYIMSYFWPVPMDVYTLAGFVFQKQIEQFPNFKLETLAAAFDVELDAHDSLSDIRATRSILKELEKCINVE